MWGDGTPDFYVVQGSTVYQSLMGALQNPEWGCHCEAFSSSWSVCRGIALGLGGGADNCEAWGNRFHSGKEWHYYPNSGFIWLCFCKTVVASSLFLSSFTKLEKHFLNTRALYQYYILVHWRGYIVILCRIEESLDGSPTEFKEATYFVTLPTFPHFIFSAT